MKTIFQACQPRPEVLQGDLRENIFAARLRDVIEGTADDVYRDAQKFFENTFPTDGIKDLLNEALGRLTAKKARHSPVIRLETAFGGGKTHALIALYHAAQGLIPKKLVDRFVDSRLLPDKPIKLLAGVVGSDMEPAVGLLHKETGIKTFTLAGEIAHQLRGKKGYEILKEADQGKNAVGTQTLEQLVGNEPCLIMLDELGRYLRDASSVPTKANPRITLAETTVATLMSLLEFASSKANVVIVLTLADSSDAFGKESDEIRRELQEAKKVSARQERVITPSNEAEMPAIVTHRLFERIDRDAAKEIIDQYKAYYGSLRDKDSDLSLPDRVHRADFIDEMRKDFPFHPTLLLTLRRKTSTISSFQQTRGALRLLARSVRQIWEKKPKGLSLLHIHDLDLSLDDIANDLTSRLERPQFRQVIESDLVSPRKGTQAHAQELDRERVADGKPPYAYRLGAAIFLHSLTQGVATGIDTSELAEAVLTPGDEPAYLKRILANLEDRCWFLDYDGDRYRFKTEPSLNKLIADEAQSIPTTRAKQDLEDWIHRIWKQGTFKPIYFPSEPAEVDDDAEAPKLVVIQFDAAPSKETDENQAAPDLVLRLFEHSGSMEGYRSYRNNVLFLAADADHVDRMVVQMRRYLAIHRIVNDSGRMNELNKEQREKLKKARDSAELDVRVAITRVYRFLFYPSEDAPKKCRGLRRHTLPAPDQGEVKADQAAVILRTLKSLGKVLTKDDAPKAAAWLKAKAWPMSRTSISTEEVRKEFARRIGLPMLLDISQLKETIKNGIKAEEWIYYDAEAEVGYGSISPLPAVACGENTFLYEVKEARSQKIRIKGEEPTASPKECPVCGEWPCTCGDQIGPGPARATTLDATGAPAEAFQKLRDQCGDRGIRTLKRVAISLEGSGPDCARELKSLGLAIPQMGKGNYTIEQKLACEFAKDDTFISTFRGGWERYKRLKQVTDAFAGEAEKLTATTVLTAEFPEGLDVSGSQFDTMRDVLAGLEIGRVTIRAEQYGEKRG